LGGGLRMQAQSPNEITCVPPRAASWPRSYPNTAKADPEEERFARFVQGTNASVWQGMPLQTSTTRPPGFRNSDF
jgi:hypothetical protein